jgi:hypothetical protein
LKKLHDETLINTSEIDQLDISLIRKIFKPLFIPKLESNFPDGLPYNMKSDLEIKIVFEFPEDFYDKIYDCFSIVSVVKRLGHRKFKPEISMDRSAVNELVKNCQSDLLIQLVNKNNLLDVNLIYKVEVINQSVHLNGSYLKFSRDIGQSPWEVKGEKICQSSVQEEMENTLKEIFLCDRCVLSAGGREDRDVRMLGSGRPFIIEIVNPKRKYELV